VNYSQYYKAKLEGALLYQDFVVDLLWNTIGLAVVCYSSKAYQQAVGESRTGVEIKHDEKFSKTGNLWIEVAEKAKPRPGPYAASGIYRDDNSWLYVSGNYNTVFVFPKRLLQALAKSGRYKILENNTGTSQGYLLPEADARKYACVVLQPNKSDKVAKLVNDLASLGRELHADLFKDAKQRTLFQ
jgi:hypothetical protein